MQDRKATFFSELNNFPLLDIKIIIIIFIYTYNNTNYFIFICKHNDKNIHRCISNLNIRHLHTD